jgi:hypothetical protein
MNRLCEKYLEHAKKNKWSWDRDEGVMKKVRSFFADKPINRVLAWDIERDKAKSLADVPKVKIDRHGEQRATEIRKATFNREIAIIKQMSRLAVDWKFLEKTRPRPLDSS